MWEPKDVGDGAGDDVAVRAIREGGDAPAARGPVGVVRADEGPHAVPSVHHAENTSAGHTRMPGALATPKRWVSGSSDGF